MRGLITTEEVEVEAGWEARPGGEDASGPPAVPRLQPHVPGLQPHASRLQPYASSLQAHAPQPPATLCLQVPLFRISAWLICAFGGVRTTLLTTSLAGAIRMAGWWALLTMAALAVAALAVAVLTVALLWLY